MLVAADARGYFSLGSTVQSSTRNYYEAPIRSNGNITLSRVSYEFGGRRYSFTVTVSYAEYTWDIRRRDDRPVYVLRYILFVCMHNKAKSYQQISIQKN